MSGLAVAESHQSEKKVVINPDDSSRVSIYADTPLNFWSLVSSITEAKIKATSRLADIERLLLELSNGIDPDGPPHVPSSCNMAVST